MDDNAEASAAFGRMVGTLRKLEDERLTEREREVRDLVMDQRLSCGAAGRALGVTCERVRHLRDAVIKKRLRLRSPLGGLILLRTSDPHRR